MKAVDTFLKSKGFLHLILIVISPLKSQVLHREDRHRWLPEFLVRHQLEVMYLLDINKIDALHLSDVEKEALYYDDVHLEKKGHALWGRLISDELRRRLPRP